MVGPVGLELTTRGLEVARSAQIALSHAWIPARLGVCAACLGMLGLRFIDTAIDRAVAWSNQT
jgi:hypothetical protein